jgi:environmental stress-induced protein Ves
MQWTHLKPADGRRMPWKNGGGTTLELALEPPGANLETGFQWRISSAEVRASGPFSLFPGLDRWLFLLEGAGFEIDFGAHGQMVLIDPLVPVHFSGDWPAKAALVDGPCTDAGLMVDPRRCEARLEVISLASSVQLPLASATTLLFVTRGTVSVPVWNLHLGRRHLLRIEHGEGALAIAPGVGGAALVRMDLEPV